MVLNQACIYVDSDGVQHLAVVTRTKDTEFTNLKGDKETFTETDVFVYDNGKVVAGVALADTPTKFSVSPL